MEEHRSLKLLIRLFSLFAVGLVAVHEYRWFLMQKGDGILSPIAVAVLPLAQMIYFLFALNVPDRTWRWEPDSPFYRSVRPDFIKFLLVQFITIGVLTIQHL